MRDWRQRKKATENELENLEKMKKLLTLEFKNLAQNVLDEKVKMYKTQAADSLTSILNPFKTKIDDFKKKVEEYYQDEGQKRHSLDEAVKGLKVETDQLNNILKGHSQAQGDWGELVLERILEVAGLREEEEFVIQGKGLRLKTEEGNILKPDVIVKLPENRHIVIDSKASLIHYQKYQNSQSEEEKKELSSQIEKSLLKHVRDLSEKSYGHSSQITSPEFTLMFIPLEGVFTLILRNQKIFDEAWSKSIILVNPTNLLATLKTVAAIWRQERQNKNAREIAEESGKMHDKFVNFVEDVEHIGRDLNTARKNYDKAWNKLKDGKGNLIDRAKKIKDLGASSKKALPLDLISDDPKEKIGVPLKN